MRKEPRKKQLGKEQPLTEKKGLSYLDRNHHSYLNYRILLKFSYFGILTKNFFSDFLCLHRFGNYIPMEESMVYSHALKKLQRGYKNKIDTKMWEKYPLCLYSFLVVIVIFLMLTENIKSEFYTLIFIFQEDLQELKRGYKRGYKNKRAKKVYQKLYPLFLHKILNYKRNCMEWSNLPFLNLHQIW